MFNFKNRYKSEYQESISDIDAIKVEMNSVKTKVSRAELLLASLSAEQGRWEESAAQFHNQMSTIVGDGLLAAAFASYGGCFDHKNRKNLREEWGMIVSNLGIPHRTDLNDSLVEYLSRAKQVHPLGK
jgi:dynein heavy chain 1, cytosolic